MEEENVNHIAQEEEKKAADEGIEYVAASGIDEGLAAFKLEEEAVDKHPEKRAKAAYKKFEEDRMHEMRKEFPTLKHSQLKERIWKEVSNDVLTLC